MRDYETVCIRLTELRNNMERRRKVSSMLQDLEEQRQDLLTWEDSLAQAWGKEENDVEKIERGLLGFLAALRGGKEERLEKERAEAYAAKLRYDAKVRERKDVEGRIASLRREQEQLDGMQQEYDALLQEKKILLRQRNDALGEKIDALEEQIARAKADQKEVDEAIAAGRGVQNAIQGALEHLNTAADYGVWDMIGGGTFSTLMKHSAMDDAHNEIERVQWNLSRFSTELRDVQLYIDTDLPTGGMLGFADLFFDNFFTDWMVQEKIDGTRNSVIHCGEQVDQVMERLAARRREIEANCAELEREIADLVANAK